MGDWLFFFNFPWTRSVSSLNFALIVAGRTKVSARFASCWASTAGDSVSFVKQALCLKGVAYGAPFGYALLWRFCCARQQARWRYLARGELVFYLDLGIFPNSSATTYGAVDQAAGFPLDERVWLCPPPHLFLTQHVLALYRFLRLLGTPYGCREPPIVSPTNKVPNELMSQLSKLWRWVCQVFRPFVGSSEQSDCPTSRKNPVATTASSQIACSLSPSARKTAGHIIPCG